MKTIRMHRLFRSALRGACAVLVALATPLSLGNIAIASTPPDFVLDLDPSIGCAFGLHIEGRGSPKAPQEFYDKHGNLVRVLTTGKGYALSFTNVSTNATLTLKANGSVSETTINPDGSQTVRATGHNVIVMFPTDIPAGPSTTLYVGRVVYTVDSSGSFTLQGFSGQTTDICAALSS